MTWYERLSVLDASFLDLEDGAAHMHVGSVSIFEGKAPARRDLAALIASRLDRVPRYRQRLATVPYGLGRPVWVDDAAFDIEDHVRVAALPRPGGMEELKRLAADRFGEPLDRGRPLWEHWLVEGLARNRFAILSKTHHCMVDGISGVDLASVLLDAEAKAGPPAESARWTPRPVPDGTTLLGEALRDQLRRPFDVAREALSPETEGRRTLLEMVAGLWPLAGLTQMGPAPDSSLNRPIGPHRRWEMLSIDLGEVKRVRAALSATVNDVVLAVVAGALRTLLMARGEPPGPEVRVLVPVSVRGPEGRGTLGNQVTAVFCTLPIGEPDPVERLRKVSNAMKGLKESRQAVGALALTHLGSFAPPTLVALAARLQSVARWFNLVVTNVPGPQQPLYLLGRKLLACHPEVPLASGNTLGIALLSYNGAIDIGLLGDAEHMRDLPTLARAIPEALGELVARAAGKDGSCRT